MKADFFPNVVTSGKAKKVDVSVIVHSAGWSSARFEEQHKQASSSSSSSAAEDPLAICSSSHVDSECHCYTLGPFSAEVARNCQNSTDTEALRLRGIDHKGELAAVRSDKADHTVQLVVKV